MNPLDEAMATYERHRGDLCRDSLGQFAVIHDDRILGTFPDYESALQAGYDACGLAKRFFIKEIAAVDRVHFL